MWLRLMACTDLRSCPPRSFGRHLSLGMGAVSPLCYALPSLSAPWLLCARWLPRWGYKGAPAGSSQRAQRSSKEKGESTEKKGCLKSTQTAKEHAERGQGTAAEASRLWSLKIEGGGTAAGQAEGMQPAERQGLSVRARTQARPGHLPP